MSNCIRFTRDPFPADIIERMTPPSNLFNQRHLSHPIWHLLQPQLPDLVDPPITAPRVSRIITPNPLVEEGSDPGGGGVHLIGSLVIRVVEGVIGLLACQNSFAKLFTLKMMVWGQRGFI